MKLILARHGETSLNKSGRIQGLNADPLNQTGGEQAHALASALRHELPFKLYTSPVPRAQETAQVIAGALALNPETLEDLKEADPGELEGLTGAQMRDSFPEFAKRWAADSGNAQMPSGESLAQVQERAWRSVCLMLERHEDEVVVAVTHNFVVQTIVCKVLQIPIHTSRRFRPDLGSITRLEIAKEHSALVSLNETLHLQGIDA